MERIEILICHFEYFEVEIAISVHDIGGLKVSGQGSHGARYTTELVDRFTRIERG
jgi:hypothetical protein